MNLLNMFVLQNPVTLPSLTIFLAPGSPTQLVRQDGIYIGNSEQLFMGSNGKFASLPPIPGSDTNVCLTTVPGLAASLMGQWVGPRLLFVQDGACYGWGDNRPSGVKLFPPGQIMPNVGPTGTPCPYGTIVIPGAANPGPSGPELLLFNSLTAPTVFTIAPAAYALAHFNVQSLGG